MTTRVSSTPLNDFERCHRLWAFVHASGEDTGVGYAAGVGSVVHAILEHRIQNGAEPTLAEVLAMPGNYDPPSVPLRAYESRGIWEEALATARAVDDPWHVVPLSFDDVVVEQPVDAFDLRVGDVQISGYIDLFAFDPHTNTALVHDWKTRGKSSWRYRPGDTALATNRQLSYYAAAVRQATGAEGVYVQHGNLLRAGDGKPVFELVKAYMNASYLDAFWANLCENTLPQMQAVHRLWSDPERRYKVPASTDRCFDYGPCAQQRRCNALDGASPERRHTLDRLTVDKDVL